MKGRKNSRPPTRNFSKPQGRVPIKADPKRLGPGERWVIGLHSAREVLKVRPQAVLEAWLRQGWESSSDLRKLEDQLKNFTAQPDAVLDRLGSGNQGVALRVKGGPELNWAHLEELGQGLILILDGIQDPHNLGAILRTAWLFGAKAVFIPELRSSPLTATVCKVASGGAEHVPVVVEQNLQEVAAKLKSLDYWVFGLSAEGRGTVWQNQFPAKVALVIGSEGAGIRVPLARCCDELTRIPQVDSEASLNASVAAAVVMAEVVRQHAQLVDKS